MSTRILLSGLVLLVVVVPTVAAQPSVDTLTVLTYNLHGLLDDGNPPKWDSDRTAWLVDAIIDLDPDIVGFQEVLQTRDSDGSDNQAQALATALKNRTGVDWDVRVAVSHVSWGRFEEGIAVLTKHPILSSSEWALSASDVFQRKLLKASIDTPIGQIQFYTTHLAYRGEADSIRTAQVQEIKYHVWNRETKSNPAIVVGDFNTEPDKHPIELAIGAQGTGRLVDTFLELYPDKPGFTFPADRPDRRIDYVFVNDPTVLIPVRAEVVLDKDWHGRLLSDHLGVLVEFVPHPTAGMPR